MKFVILAVFAAGVLAGSAYYVNRSKAAHVQRTESAAYEIAIPAEEKATVATPPRTTNLTAASERHAESASNPAPAQPAAQMSKSAVAEAIDVLVSPQATHDQKQAAWKALREGGGLDQAMADLQLRLAANPSNAEYAAVLGHACLQKCGTISDVRDQGMLAMQADKLFDTALSLDSQNWEARFTKAVALSYWPASMGKTDEVIQHFLTLIQQQETQPPQPQFAESYAWLGDQYQKAGRNDDAHAAWARGAALFPGNQKLSTRLASNP